MSVKKKVIVLNKDGIHARPSSIIVSCAKKYCCDVFIHKKSQKGDAKNILDLMSMALSYGSELEIECDGENEQAALEEISHLFGKEFNFERN